MNPFGWLADRPAPRLGLALGGGGAKGIAHIEMLKVLDDLGVKPAVISGTSMGALIGSLYAFGHNGLGIERIFTELNLVDLISYVDVALGAKYGLIRGDNIIKTLDKVIKHTRFEDLRIPLKVVATDFWSREEVVFSQGNVADAVRASISIPGIFEPVVRDNRVLTDGGAVNSLPYELIRNDCDLLVAVNVLGEISPEVAPATKPTLYEAILYTFQIMEAANLENKLGRSRPDILVQPKLHDIGILDFHKVGQILSSVAEDAAGFREALRKVPGLVPGR
jgi:NTE family protein